MKLFVFFTAKEVISNYMIRLVFFDILKMFFFFLLLTMNSCKIVYCKYKEWPSLQYYIEWSIHNRPKKLFNRNKTCTSKLNFFGQLWILNYFYILDIILYTL